MKAIIKQLKTLPTAAVNNEMSWPQVVILTVSLIVLIVGGMYWADPTSLNPYKP